MKPTCIPDKLYEAQKDVFDAVIAEVIEECAEVVETTKWSNWFQSDCAAAIRARGGK